MAAKGTTEQAAERRIKALEFRKAGASYRAIGSQLGVSEAQAHKDVMRALASLAKQELSSASEYRTMELERLDMAALAVVQRVKQGDLGAIDRWLRIIEARRKLLGIDAPIQFQEVPPESLPDLSDADFDRLYDKLFPSRRG